MRTRILSAVAALFLAASMAFAVLAVATVPSAEPQPAPPAAEPLPTASPVITTEALPSGDSPTPLPTHALTDIRDMDVAADGVIAPPDFDHIYRVHGLPDGPVWLAAHARSRGRGTAPGNTFLDFQVGDRIEALGASWLVTERWSASKGDAGEQGPYSDAQAYSGRLIIVSCLPREGGAALSNTWLVAEPIGAS